MAAPFKDRIGPELVQQAGHHLARVWEAFDRRRWNQLANRGLETLELKARVRHLATALEAVLPANFAQAAAVIERSLAPARDDEDLSALQTSAAGLAGWVVWPMTEFVAKAGFAEPRRALQALHALTQRFSAEFAIRPFLVEHRSLTFATLRQWVRDRSAHVRRLVSEGSRPRLPWGMHLDFLIADPTATLPLLEALQDDASGYVRRSVANHLNDIGKDHPKLIAEWLETHLPDATRQRRAMLRHASRTLIKCSDRRVLRAWGVGRPLHGEARFSVVPKRAVVGGEVQFEATLRSFASGPQKLVVDYVVHHVMGNGRTSPKVRKGWTIELLPAEVRMLRKRHSLREVTTRRYHRGRHDVELLVNGTVAARTTFQLA